MLIEIIIILFLLTSIYGYLIYIIVQKNKFTKKIFLILSISLFFIIIHFFYINNLGYPAFSSLPKKFNLLSVHKHDDSFIVLIQNLNTEELPRLYMLNYSKNLEDTLNEAMDNKKNGHNVIGLREDVKNNNYYGITFKKVKRNVPSK
tara:strand:+ start:633 stop:1073 length:441 start_codon:yes stop_codon:yes gene_type:complete